VHRVVDPDIIVRPTPMGLFQRIDPQVTMSETPGFWDDPILVPRVRWWRNGASNLPHRNRHMLAPAHRHA
jgi:hypothetical protein